MSKTTTNPDIRKEALQRAHVLVTHLDAQINVTYGNGGETFREMADHLQDSYMWAVAERIDELQACIEKAIYGDKAGAA